MTIASRRIYSLAVLLVIALFSFTGCPKKTEVTSTPEGQGSKKEAVTQPSTPSPETGKQATAAGSEEMKEKSAATEALKPIYFDFNKPLIRDDAKDVMKANAAWLKAHPKVKIKIEGNCDERGTKEYNQALGERRAASAKRYLTDMGISGSRISLISYGKEKPVCTESDESCWQKNRRDDFVANE
ncbi:MAG TPA: peptidoglycan-associated lipoprotein Pal [Nitrospirota bacterium]|nr:peptidoglycan-associated lipoprotein Pal [Nitrospirota bacterium]